jgi:segregation and condensation protein A
MAEPPIDQASSHESEGHTHAPPIQSFSYLERMVTKPTWKEILLDLIASDSVDPWNIDLVVLSDAFLKRIKEMEKMDFVVPANVILAAAILLKYKSNYLKFLNYQSELPEFMPEAEASGAGVEQLPLLTLSSRIPPKRQITAEDLLGEMERMIKYDTGERVSVPRGSIVEIVDLELPEHDIEHDLSDVLERIRAGTDSEGWSLFSRLTEGYDLRRTVYTLLCLLHLAQNESVDLHQDEIFGELFVRMLKPQLAESAANP